MDRLAKVYLVLVTITSAEMMAWSFVKGGLGNAEFLFCFLIAGVRAFMLTQDGVQERGDISTLADAVLAIAMLHISQISLLLAALLGTLAAEVYYKNSWHKIAFALNRTVAATWSMSALFAALGGDVSLAGSPLSLVASLLAYDLVNRLYFFGFSHALHSDSFRKRFQGLYATNTPRYLLKFSYTLLAIFALQYGGPFWLGVLVVLFVSLSRVLRDLHQTEREKNQATYAATHDALTGLLNRTGFFRVAETLMAEARLQKSSLAISVIDVDQFKVINDTFGHAIGDEVLRLFAQHLTRSLRNTDVVARLGGDEFVVIQRGARLAEARAHLADTVQCKGLYYETGRSKEPMPHGSFGMAEFPTSGMTMDALLERADEWMYAQKRSHQHKVAKKALVS